MYDYRRMTLEERQAIVEHRRSRGYPWHKPPQPLQGEGWYFITAATYEHLPHFSQPCELTALERRLLEALDQTGLPRAGWVVLPNHYHLLVYAPKLKQVGQMVGGVHGRSGQYANQRDKTLGRRVWYKYTDRKIRSERHFWACLHYIVFNPVKHGYSEQMGEWPWSCYHDLLHEHGAEWMDDLVRRYPLLDFGQEWDVM